MVVIEPPRRVLSIRNWNERFPCWRFSLGLALARLTLASKVSGGFICPASTTSLLSRHCARHRGARLVAHKSRHWPYGVAMTPSSTLTLGAPAQDAATFARMIPFSAKDDGGR